MQAARGKACDAAELTSRSAATEAEDRQSMPLGTRVRLLLVGGGGGCGKTQIINRVHLPLLEAFYGPQGVMKEASSN